MLAGHKDQVLLLRPLRLFIRPTCGTEYMVLSMRKEPLPAADLQAPVEAFVADYNHHCYNESIDNLSLAGVRFERG